MTMNKIDYTRIRSLSDLRAERRRVKREMESTERRMNENYQMACHALSPERLFGSLSRKAQGAYSLIQTAYSSYEFIRDIVRKRKAKKEAKRHYYD